MNLVKILKALGDPSRCSIYLLLLERKHCVRSLSKKLGITESAVSQHLKVMREAGLVYGERCGYHIHYFPNQNAIDFLALSFEEMRNRSMTLDRDPDTCSCEFRRNNNEHFC
ncbi:MAG: winged helix-turn-helix transcriptional regulator [Clostridia bacterium]|nr:winged helix-turn-helix transcriptional regulator [Clostridia bacterium]